jgi:hypothetical protein
MTRCAGVPFGFVDEPTVCILARASFFLVTFSTAGFTPNLSLATTIGALLLYDHANLFLAKLIGR